MFVVRSFCTLVLLEQNQVVDLVVVEHRLVFCILNSFRFCCDV